MANVIADGQTTTYTYYDNGSKHQVIYPIGATEEYTYYDNGMLQTLVNKKADQAIIDAYTYTYDESHNLTAKEDARGVTTYTYDDLNRLETVTEPSSKITSYTYDGAGNRLTQVEDYQENSIVTNYTYNEQNRLLRQVSQLNGEIIQNEVSEYTYDELNRMITALTPNGTNITNSYNGDGQRVSKQVNSDMTQYVYIGDKVVLELDSSGNQAARNVLGTGMISRTVDGTTLYYMYNGHGDVTALIDSTGVIQATYYYDAFGNILESTGEANNPYTYAGYQYDKETEYYYLNARYYDALTARFITEDTYRGDPRDPLTLNLYTYGINNPIRYIDPTGHYIDESKLGKIASDPYYSSVKLTYSPGKGDKLTITTADGFTFSVTDNRRGIYIDPTNIVHDISGHGNVKSSSDIKSTATSTVQPSAASPYVPPVTNTTKSNPSTTIKPITVTPKVVAPIADTRTANEISKSVTTDNLNKYGAVGYVQEMGNGDPTMWSVAQNFGGGL